MKKVKFLTTSTGDYGSAFAGDEKEVQDSLAEQLEEKGTVKILGSAGKDPEPEKERSSISLKDNTGKKSSTQVLSKSTTKAPVKPAAKKR